MENVENIYAPFYENIFMPERYNLQVTRTYGDVPNPDTRQLQEFSIHGQKVMAYSRKDAIKRLKHKKK